MFESRVACICGLPGIGSVGKVAADYLSNALKCSSIKPFYSHSFPSQVMVSDGLAELMHAELLRSQDKENIFVLSGDTQPLDVQGMYQLAGEILQAIESEGVTDVITLAAFVGDATAKILGSATDAGNSRLKHRLSFEMCSYNSFSPDYRQRITVDPSGIIRISLAYSLYHPVDSDRLIGLSGPFCRRENSIAVQEGVASSVVIFHANHHSSAIIE